MKRAVRLQVQIVPEVSASRMKINIQEEGREVRGAAKEDVYRYVATPAGTWVDLQEVSEADLTLLAKP